MDNPATTDLMNTLSSATNEKNLDEYLNMLSELGYQKTFAGYYEYMLKKKDLLKSEAIAASYLNNIYAYQILEGKKKAGREKILCLCIGAGFNLEETAHRGATAELNHLDTAMLVEETHKLLGLISLILVDELLNLFIVLVQLTF